MLLEDPKPVIEEKEPRPETLIIENHAVAAASREAGDRLARDNFALENESRKNEARKLIRSRERYIRLKKTSVMLLDENETLVKFCPK